MRKTILLSSILAVVGAASLAMADEKSKTAEVATISALERITPDASSENIAPAYDRHAKAEKQGDTRDQANKHASDSTEEDGDED